MKHVKSLSYKTFSMQRHRSHRASREDQEVSLSRRNWDIRRIRGTSEEQLCRNVKGKKRKRTDKRERDRETAVMPGAGGVHCAGRAKQGVRAQSLAFTSFLPHTRASFALSPLRRSRQATDIPQSLRSFLP